jgi:DNA-binding response OmpR family regulator
VGHSVLVVDDDARLRELLTALLAQHGFAAAAVRDGGDMSTIMAQQAFDLLILDVNLPGINGMDLCRTLRDQGNQIPIIMLTARSEDVDRIGGLELGADDYLPKPFNALELIARIKAVLRRRPALSSLHETNPPFIEAVAFGPFVFDCKNNQLKRGNHRIKLSPTEQAVLKILVLNAGTPVSRSEISQQLRDRDVFPDERTIDVFISKIRKHLGTRENGDPYIQTVRNKGYLLLTSSVLGEEDHG